MGAAAAALAVVDRAVAECRQDPVGVAGDLHDAVLAARPLLPRYQALRRVSLSATMDRRPVPEPTRRVPADSPLVGVAFAVFQRAGVNRPHTLALVGRLAVALDVAVEHWTAGAAPGEGLPEFPPEGALRSTKRLAALLGGERDLLPLVYGPQPGRGRPLQVARRRGLAYWVALYVRAEQLGEDPPPLPYPVVRHWRTELDRLQAASQGVPVPALDSLDTPCA
jgi:hypothetical protein